MSDGGAGVVTAAIGVICGAADGAASCPATDSGVRPKAKRIESLRTRIGRLHRTFGQRNLSRRRGIPDPDVPRRAEGGTTDSSRTAGRTGATGPAAGLGAAFCSHHCARDPAVESRLAEAGVYVAVAGPLADSQPAGDLLVAKASPHALHDLKLPRGQLVLDSGELGGQVLQDLCRGSPVGP